MARDAFGERARHINAIWLLIVDAVETIDRVPDQEKRWLTSGYRSGGWNMVGMTKAESAIVENARLMSAMKPNEGATKLSPQRDDIDRALEVLSWLGWIDNWKLRRAAVTLARQGDSEAVRRIYCPNRKPSRQIAYDIRTRTSGMILGDLNRYLRIGIGPDLRFVEA